MQVKTTELVAPAGSFCAAYYAFTNGADAVYAGLPAFSARQHARNLNLDELSRLKQLAADKQKKIYLAVNTVIREEEIADLAGLLYDIDFLEADGIIIQDPGLLSILQKHFPALPVHISTQMAVHNPDGIRFLKQAGVKRVILPRELGFTQIREIREQVPDIELEVFIHGALCYGYSGLCLTSGLLLGRSGNRGDCAQVCRSWFKQAHGRECGYYFSCNDLALNEQILTLKAIGIDALKIEGRMKSPEYAGLTAAYYHALLEDGVTDAQAPALEKIQLSFSRNRTTAFFSSARGENPINTGYPSHTGVAAGIIKESTTRQLEAHITHDIAVHDGILFFGSGNPAQPVRFGIDRIIKNDRPVFEAIAGDLIRIESKQPFPALPLPGTPLYKISDADIQWPEIKPGALAPWKHRVQGRITLTNESIAYTLVPGVNSTMPVAPQTAEGAAAFQGILADSMARGGDSLFKIENPEFINTSSLESAKIFIRPSLLKQFKNNVYAALQAWHLDNRAMRIREITAEALDHAQTYAVPQAGYNPSIARSAITYDNSPMPFLNNPLPPEIDRLPLLDGKYVIALPPIIEEPQAYLSGLCSLVAAHPQVSFLIGLNNISHLAWVKTLGAYPGIAFFIDYCLYCANLFAFRYYTAQVPGLAFVIYWIEGKQESFRRLSGNVSKSGIPLVRVDEDFRPHLFLSKICFRKHSLKKSCADCIGNEEFRIEQNRIFYQVVVKNCYTYVFKE